VILSRHGQLPTEASRAFLTQSAEVLKSLTDARQRNAATSEWAVALGESLLGEVTVRAKTGSWTKAGAASGHMEALIKQAPDDAARARLYAVDSQMKQQLGSADKSTQSLDAALAIAAKISSVPERAAMLRAIAQLSGAAGHERMQAALVAVQTQADSKSGLERAQAYTQLSLLYADAGLRGKSAELAQLARATPGVKPDDAMLISADLVVRGDLATARVLHGIGLYSESETVLQRLGGYLS
jgi:hypothetical protein